MNPSQRQTEPLFNVEVIKQNLFNIFCCNDFDYTTLQTIAEMAKVEFQIAENMMLNIAISKDEALKILTAFSTYTGKSYTLETVQVALLPEVPENKSAVACTLAKINAEYESARRGMYEYAEGTARHTFINTKMERIADSIVGLSKNEAIQVLQGLSNESTDTATP